MFNHMTHCEEIKWDRILIWLGPNYLGKIIRRQSSRNMSSGAGKGWPRSPGQDPGAGSQALWQPLDEAVARPTRTPSRCPRWDGSGDGSQGTLNRDRRSQLGQSNPSSFTRWLLNQKEERPLAPHLEWANQRLTLFVLNRRVNEVRLIKVVLGFNREKFANFFAKFLAFCKSQTQKSAGLRSPGICMQRDRVVFL